MSIFVVPGQAITSEQGYLRGHGSYIVENSEGITLTASVAGQIDRVNKLISVRPLKSRLDCFSFGISLVIGVDILVKSVTWWLAEFLLLNQRDGKWTFAVKRTQCFSYHL